MPLIHAAAHAGQAAGVLLSVGLGLLAWVAFGPASPLSAWIERRARLLDDDLGFVRCPFRGGPVIRAQALAVVGLLGAALTSSSTVPLLAVVPLVVGPGLAARRARLVRIQALEEQLDVWVLAVANALSATPSLGDAIAASTRLVPAPMRDEVETVLREHRLGLSLARALAAMGRRVRSRVVDGALLTLELAQTTGGNARGTLEAAAETLREMARLEGVVRAKTAEGKAQAIVVSSIPAPLVGAVSLIAPDFFDPLARLPAGPIVVGAAVVLWGGAIALAVRICAVDV